MIDNCWIGSVIYIYIHTQWSLTYMQPLLYMFSLLCIFLPMGLVSGIEKQCYLFSIYTQKLKYTFHLCKLKKKMFQVLIKSPIYALVYYKSVHFLFCLFECIYITVWILPKTFFCTCVQFGRRINLVIDIERGEWSNGTYEKMDVTKSRSKDLPDLVKEYEPKDIYNYNENGFFHQIMPDWTFGI